ncbi:MAG: SprT-like domain-containing protein [Bdellovibrionales bacterium]|nr:SprT-like domain-containing protein [Bdellovibrionales bacterium]
MDLTVIFDQLNHQHFDGFLDRPKLIWNTRLRTSSGRFLPGRRSQGLPATIEIAQYLLEELHAETHVRETIAHEMIHYWLWVRKRPYGHTEEFYEKMQSIGARRYNPVPRKRPYKYLYQCLACQRVFKARKKLGTLACADCCRSHARGKYDARFKLVLAHDLSESAEGRRLLEEES